MVNMERMSIKIPSDHNEIGFLGDLHYGNGNFGAKQFQKAKKRILDKEQYIVLMGDLIEGRPPSHPFFVPGSPTVQEQKKWAMKEFQEIADAGLLLGIISGNHEGGMMAQTTLDIVGDIAEHYNVKWLKDMAYLQVKHKKDTYGIIMAHGGGNTTTINGIVTKLQRFARSFPTDAIVMGHTHQLFSIPDTFIRFDENMDYDACYRQVANTGTFLKSYNWDKESYPERKNYNPTPLGYLVFEMDNGVLQPKPYYIK